MSTQLVHVAVGVVVNAAGKILVAHRPKSSHQGDKWEFPGGKCEAGESVEQALVREFQEEVAITPLAYQPLLKIQHDYGDKQVLLDVWKITQYEGEAQGKEGQPIRWLSVAELSPAEFPAANRAIIASLKLPDTCLITPNVADYGQETFLQAIAQAIYSGCQLIQLRSHALALNEYCALAQEVSALCRDFSTVRLLLNMPYQDWLDKQAQLDADGLHLSASQLALCRQRPVADNQWLSAACHSLDELQQAARLAVDFALLSPVKATASHPEATPLGWDQFQACVNQVNMPVYALGGLGMDDIDQAQQHGAQGVAAIRGFWPV